MASEFHVYRIFYGEELVYVGRTMQPIKDRIRAHLLRPLNKRVIDIKRVTKIEYADLDTESDMNLYEIYYINLFKPVLNIEDKSMDPLTIRLPELSWKVFTTPMWSRWEREIAKNDRDLENTLLEREAFQCAKKYLERQVLLGECPEEDFEEFLDQRTAKSKSLMWQIYYKLNGEKENETKEDYLRDFNSDDFDDDLFRLLS